MQWSPPDFPRVVSRVHAQQPLDVEGQRHGLASIRVVGVELKRPVDSDETVGSPVGAAPTEIALHAGDLEIVGGDEDAYSSQRNPALQPVPVVAAAPIERRCPAA